MAIFGDNGVSEPTQTLVRTPLGYELHFDTDIRSVRFLGAEKNRFWEGSPHYPTLSHVCSVIRTRDLKNFSTNSSRFVHFSRILKNLSCGTSGISHLELLT